MYNNAADGRGMRCLSSTGCAVLSYVVYVRLVKVIYRSTSAVLYGAECLMLLRDILARGPTNRQTKSTRDATQYTHMKGYDELEVSRDQDISHSKCHVAECTCTVGFKQTTQSLHDSVACSGCRAT